MILFRARTVLDKSNGKLVKNYYKQTSRMPDIWNGEYYPSESVL